MTKKSITLTEDMSVDELAAAITELYISPGLLYTFRRVLVGLGVLPLPAFTKDDKIFVIAWVVFRALSLESKLNDTPALKKFLLNTSQFCEDISEMQTSKHEEITTHLTRKKKEKTEEFLQEMLDIRNKNASAAEVALPPKSTREHVEAQKNMLRKAEAALAAAEAAQPILDTAKIEKAKEDLPEILVVDTDGQVTDKVKGFMDGGPLPEAE